MTWIKRIRCKHRWKTVKPVSVWLDGVYGCTKCGKTEEVRFYEHGKWRFKREMKGDTFV